MNEPDEPRPVPAGTSAITLTSERIAVPVAQQRLAQDRVADLGRIVDLLELRVLHPVPALEDGVGEHVDVLVDRAADEEAAVLAVVGGEIGAAAAEADAQRRSAEDDAHATASLVEDDRVLLEPVDGPSDRVSDRQRRSPAQRADALAVEVDQRAVARPAADAAGVLELGCDAERRSDRRDRVVDDDASRRSRGCRPELRRLRVAASGRRASSPRRSRRRRDTTSPGDRRRARAGATDRAAGCDRSRRRGRACSARRGSRRSERSTPDEAVPVAVRLIRPSPASFEAP